MTLTWPAEVQSRIDMTCSCRDADALPRHPLAGEISDVQIMHNGVKVVTGGYHGGWMAEIIRRLKGVHEPQEERVFHEILQHLGHAEAMMELGAFWSYYAIWFRTVFPSARSILVEPDPNNLEIGKRNFELNGFTGEFHLASAGASPLAPRPFPCESDGQTREIPEISVDDLLDQQGIQRLDLLLSDIQGAETGMLAGASRSIRAGRIRCMLISTHDASISGDYLTHQKCLAAVQELGGHIIAEHTVEESFSGDGLIAVSFDPTLRFETAVSHNRPGNSLFGSSEKRLQALAQRCAHLEQELSTANARLEAVRKALNP